MGSLKTKYAGIRVIRYGNLGWDLGGTNHRRELYNVGNNYELFAMNGNHWENMIRGNL